MMRSHRSPDLLAVFRGWALVERRDRREGREEEQDAEIVQRWINAVGELQFWLFKLTFWMYGA